MTGDRQPTQCPADEQLAAYAEGRLAGTVAEDVERHLVGCVECLDVVAACLPERPTTASSAASMTAAARTSRKSRAREWRRRWAWAASVVLVVGGLLLIAAEFPMHGLGLGLSRLASRWLGKQVHVDAVALRVGSPGTFVVSLHDVRFGRAGDFLRAEEVEVTVALAALASGGSPVRQIRLLRPVVEVDHPAALAVVWSQEQAARALATLGDVDRIDVVDGRVVVRGTTLGVNGVNGGLERGAQEAKLVLQGRAGTGLVTLDGSVQSEPARSAVTIAGRDVDAALIPGLADRLQGTAVLRVDVTSSGDDVRIDGRLAVQHGRVLGRSPMELLGLDHETTALISAAAPQLAAADAAFDEARAVFSGRKGSWRFPRVFVTAGDTIAGARVRLEQGTLSGRGTVRVPPRIASVLAARVPAIASGRDGDPAVLPFVVSGSVDAPRFELGGR